MTATPIVTVAVQIIAAVLGAIGSIAVAYLLRKFKLDGDQRLKDNLLKAVTNATDFGVAHASDISGAIGANKVMIKNTVIAKGVEYLNQTMPDTLKKFAGPEGIEAYAKNLIVAELGGREPGGSEHTLPPLTLIQPAGPPPAPVGLNADDLHTLAARRG